ncbi:SAVED domain-containing protein [Ramlibacter sp. WS9]|uniref:SAVED domain-containing protein n=1 Tax=Ramlibacter sp. WS9 TaxID=1882741 RepID=UPI0011442ECB|nr:SAVED domain-containing protein [Ramlibacter sp. WS9]ROZ74937.1 SAVED domain-containing protein [Ramlibacter sp. WS9]
MNKTTASTKTPSSTNSPTIKEVRTEERSRIPVDVRRDLWVAAAGRCEFRGCCKPVDRDFLTKERAFTGQHAHIIADSPGGARGVKGESERLAKDVRNLMLACYDCHARIDRHGKNNRFTTPQLQAMKREHEARIQRIYSATGVAESVPILMTFPIGAHVPNIDVEQIHFAMLENSQYRLFPAQGSHVHINRSDFDFQDNDPEFWLRAEKALCDHYTRRIEPILVEGAGDAHLTIAGFAPIPMLVKLGALIGDKTRANVLDLPNDGWLWDTRDVCTEPTFTYDVPYSLPREISIVVSVSGKTVHPEGRPVIEFQAATPDRGIIRKESHLQAFRSSFNAFLQRVTSAGARVVHLHPATPLAASVEIGRMLLPKTFEEIHVWEWQAPNWKPALRVK